MANLPSSAQYMNDLEVAQDKPVTEAVMSKVGSNINYLLDQDTANTTSIGTLQAAYNQQEVTFGPITQVFVATNGTSDHAMGSFTNLRGRPIMIAFTSGAFTSNNGGAVYGSLEIVRNGSAVTTVMSGASLGDGVYEVRWGTLGNALGATGDVEPLTLGTQSTAAYVMHSGGSMSFFDNPGAGTHTYELRLRTVGASVATAGAISGFMIEL